MRYAGHLIKEIESQGKRGKVAAAAAAADEERQQEEAVLISS